MFPAMTAPGVGALRLRLVAVKNRPAAGFTVRRLIGRNVISAGRSVSV